LVEERGEGVGAVVLAFGVRVLVLGLQGGSELDAGVEEGAGFADAFEAAVEVGGAGAAAVAEESVVVAGQAWTVPSLVDTGEVSEFPTMRGTASWDRPVELSLTSTRRMP
jgi:hypothetical protein